VKTVGVAAAVIALLGVALYLISGGSAANPIALLNGLRVEANPSLAFAVALVALLFLLITLIPQISAWFAGLSSAARAAVAVTAVLLAGLYLCVTEFLTLLSSYTDEKGTNIGGDVTLLLKILAGGGALGGLISHFMRRTSPDSGRGVPPTEDSAQPLNPIVMLSQFISVDGKPAIEGGILASIVTGVGGAWGVMFVLAKPMNIGAAKSVEDLLTTVGLSVVAGFSATALLRSLAKKLGGQVDRADLEQVEKRFRKTTEAINKNVDQVAATQDDIAATQSVATLIATADQVAAQAAAAAAQPPEAAAHRARAMELLNAADSLAGDFLQRKPESAEIMVSRSAIKKRLALLNANPQQRDSLLNEAVTLCTQALQLNPQLESAYYNRACYRALRGANEDLALIVADMKKAIELLPENKQLFASPDEHDIDSVRTRPEVAALLTAP
jgi:tetratricopeptide (TPR) repeat protein